MNPITWIVAAAVAAVLSTIVVSAIRNRKKGKFSCACGGDCSKCSHCNH